ncbi:MAG: hypothetical protein NTZ09_03480 [Candidatus Hydrogenedentes bacterium]|nr:hypothetical protein [Candidatus Hydrogenedentota bacterium]
MVDCHLDLAKIILHADGYHSPTAIIGCENNLHYIHTLNFPDKAGKLLVMRNLAKDMAKMRATSVILVAEAWSYMPEDPSIRLEVIQVVGARKDGGVVDRNQFFHRDASGEIVFDQEFVDEGPMYFLEPIREVWCCEWHRLQ